MNTMGSVIQLLGTVATLFGLGRSLWIVTRMWDRFWNAFRRRRGDEVKVIRSTDTATGVSGGSVSVRIPIDQEPTVEAALQRLALGLQDADADARRHIGRLDAKIEALEKRLDDEPDLVDARIGAALTSIDAAKRRELVRDLWIAVGGVLLTLVGQLFVLA